MKAMSALRGVRHIGRGLFSALAELGAIRMAPLHDSRTAAHRLAGALGTIARAHDLAIETPTLGSARCAGSTMSSRQAPRCSTSPRA